MAEPIQVTLPEHWYVYLQNLVRGGRFETTDDAIASGLRLIELHEHAEDRLQRLLEEGERSGDAGPWDHGAFLAEMHDANAEREAA